MPDAFDIQLKKGALVLCVLALLSRGDSYAYEIASRMADAVGMAAQHWHHRLQALIEGRIGRVGDQLVVLRVETPTRLNSRQRELLEEFAREGGEHLCPSGKSFFDKVSHEWLVKFLEHRIGDRRIIRLIEKWLKAGTMEDGQVIANEEGTPQGAVISPLLANIYLHYAFDLWVNQWRKRQARGNVIVVRYADDIVVGIDKKADAADFLKAMKARLEQFGLALHPEKTRVLEFGRFAAQNRHKRGQGRPQTFDFLGFTHISASNRWGKFMLKRISRRDRMIAALKRIKEELRKRWHNSIPEDRKSVV